MAMTPVLLLSRRRFSLMAALVLAPAVLIMEGMLDVSHGAIFALRHLLERLEHFFGYAILAGEFDKLLLAHREFCAFEPVGQVCCGCASHRFLPFGYVLKTGAARSAKRDRPLEVNDDSALLFLAPGPIKKAEISLAEGAWIDCWAFGLQP